MSLANLLEAKDIIHIRYFICVVKDSSPSGLLQNLLKMLKPNGWIQCSEIDLTTMTICAAYPHVAIEHTEALMDFVLSPDPHWKAEAQFWVASLRHPFESCGLEAVQEDRRTRPPWTLPSLHDTWILLAEELDLQLRGAGGDNDDGDDSGEGRQRMYQRAVREFESQDRGVGMHSEMVTMSGRKPGKNT